MAAGDIYSGTDWRLHFSTDDGTTWDTFDKSTSFSWTYSHQGEDIHHKDNQGKYAESQTESSTGQIQVEGYAGEQDNWETLYATAVAGGKLLLKKELVGSTGTIVVTTAARFSGSTVQAQVRQSGKYTYPFVTIGAPTLTVAA